MTSPIAKTTSAANSHHADPESYTIKQIHSLALAMLISAPLLACSEPPAPPAAPAPPVAMKESPKGFIGRQVEKAIGQAREELRTQNISISDGININVNGH